MLDKEILGFPQRAAAGGYTTTKGAPAGHGMGLCARRPKHKRGRRRGSEKPTFTR